MFSRAALLGLFAAIALSVPASAQVDSEGMGDLDAWGTRYLDRAEKEFPTRLWSGSDDEVLLGLMKSIHTSHLTPAERMLLRRVVLSPTRKPTGQSAEALLAERARLMLELGEAKAAAALAPRLKQNARGLDAETIAVDLDMASGREASACQRVSGPAPEGEYWLKLRAACAVLQENYSGAELAVEFASAQGLRDAWFIEAIFAASGDVPNPPNARFDTGLNIALSAKANLDTSRITLSTSRPGLAAAAASHPGVSPELRTRFAEIAAETGLISAETRRQILIERLDQEDFTASSMIEQALQTMTDPGATTAQKAERLNAVLSSVSSAGIARYAGTARLFMPDLKGLPKVRETAPYALNFARAALATGNGKLAREWLNASEFEGIDPPPPFEVAVLEALDMIAGGDRSAPSQRAVQTRLLEAASSSAQKQTAARILTLWTGLDLLLEQDARALMVEQSDTAERIDAYTLLAIGSAARAGAIGEAALMVLTETKGKPGDLASADLAALIAILRSIGAEDVAAGLALEASEFWQQ